MREVAVILLCVGEARRRTASLELRVIQRGAMRLRLGPPVSDIQVESIHLSAPPFEKAFPRLRSEINRDRKFIGGEA